jgi:hypothetical protein
MVPIPCTIDETSFQKAPPKRRREGEGRREEGEGYLIFFGIFASFSKWGAFL